jgi:hypothetical protein
MTATASKTREIDTSQFTGTYTWTRHPFGIYLTDGARYIADEAGAWWLVDAIASHQLDRHVAAEPFQVWTVRLDETGPGCVLTCQDGNGNHVTDQDVAFTDYPEAERTLWLVDGAVPDGTGDLVPGAVLMLPSEY